MWDRVYLAESEHWWTVSPTWTLSVSAQPVALQALSPLPGEVLRRDPETGKIAGATEKTVAAAAMGTLDRGARQALVDQLMGGTGQDQEGLLRGIRDRLDR